MKLKLNKRDFFKANSEQIRNKSVTFCKFFYDIDHFGRKTKISVILRLLCLLKVKKKKQKQPLSLFVSDDPAEKKVLKSR